MTVAMPPDPGEEEKQVREVVPVQYFNVPPPIQVVNPDGSPVPHPSQNMTQYFAINEGDEVVVPKEEPQDEDEIESGEKSDEPTEADLQPLLVDADPNALKSDNFVE